MHRFTESCDIQFRQHDINQSDTLTNVGCSTRWIDMQGYDEITVVIFRTVGTGLVQDYGLYVSAAQAGTTASLVGSLQGSTLATGSLVNATAGASGASGKYEGCGFLVLNYTQDDLAAALSGGRYVCARASLVTGTDEFGVAYIRSRAKHKTSGLLATVSGT